MQAAKFAISPLLAAVGLLTPKRPKLPASTPIPTRSDAAEVARLDAIRSRRGGAADFLTGAGGAEAAPASAKELLGQ